MLLGSECVGFIRFLENQAQIPRNMDERLLAWSRHGDEVVERKKGFGAVTSRLER